MAKAAETLGYYTVIEDPSTGWTGGLLLLNQAGRPLEFQCTLPVRPSRAHEILFGATLREHIISEVIGKLLIDKCRHSISMLCCDLHEAVALSKTCSFPIIYLDESNQREDLVFERYSKPTSKGQFKPKTSVTSKTLNPLYAHLNSAELSPESPAPRSRTLELSGATIRSSGSDFERVRAIIAGLNDLPDGAEPFERIREAIKEAQSQISRTSGARPASAA